MNLVSLHHVKEWLNIQDDEKDAFLQILIASLSRMVENYTGRMLLNDAYTEYFDGNGGRHLKLTHYPIYDNGSNFNLYIDAAREFGASTAVSSSDFYLDTDRGIIELLGDSEYLSFPKGFRNVKVSYTAGLSRFKVVSGGNDRLSIAVDSTDLSTATTLQLTAGTYNAADLVSHIQTLMTANGTYSADNFGISYNSETQKYRLYADSLFTAAWGTGGYSDQQCAALLGFDIESSAQAKNANSGSGYELFSDHAVSGLPEDITTACQTIAHHLYDDSKQGANTLMHTRKDIGKDVSIGFVGKGMPEMAKMILDNYKREPFIG